MIFDIYAGTDGICSTTLLLKREPCNFSKIDIHKIKITLIQYSEKVSFLIHSLLYNLFSFAYDNGKEGRL